MYYSTSSLGIVFFIFGYIKLAYGLKCYTDIEGKTIRTCKESEGYRTCFTRFNDTKRSESGKYNPSSFPFGVMQSYQEGTVTGRGCSTKDKVFYKECETHSYGDMTEKMCFCSFFLCNAASGLSPPAPLFALSALGATLAGFLIGPNLATSHPHR